MAKKWQFVSVLQTLRFSGVVYFYNLVTVFPKINSLGYDVRIAFALILKGLSGLKALLNRCRIKGIFRGFLRSN